jgi:hypothetical protein
VWKIKRVRFWPTAERQSALTRCKKFNQNFCAVKLVEIAQALASEEKFSPRALFKYISRTVKKTSKLIFVELLENRYFLPSTDIKFPIISIRKIFFFLVLYFFSLLIGVQCFSLIFSVLFFNLVLIKIFSLLDHFSSLLEWRAINILFSGKTKSFPSKDEKDVGRWKISAYFAENMFKRFKI